MYLSLVGATKGRPPKANGIALVILGIVGVSVSTALYAGAAKNRLPSSYKPHYNSVVKWAWGLGVGTVSLGCCVLGVIVLMTGK